MGQIPLEDEFHGIGAVRSVYRRILHSIARSVPMFPGWRARIHMWRGVHIGNNVFIGSDVFIDNTYPEDIFIEDSVTIISRTMIIGHSFNPLHLEKVLSPNGQSKRGVKLSMGSYVGAQCIIMPGVTIGECAIIGAGSIVTEDIPAYSLAMGSPARVVRSFLNEDVTW